MLRATLTAFKEFRGVSGLAENRYSFKNPDGSQGLLDNKTIHVDTYAIT